METLTPIEPNLVFGVAYIVLCIIVIISIPYRWYSSMVSRKSKKYIYGSCLHSEMGIRFRVRKTSDGDIEFVMWSAGEQGHVEDCWLKAHSSFKKSFIRDDKYEFIKIIDLNT